MKKLFLIISLVVLTVVIPLDTFAWEIGQPLVPCGLQQDYDSTPGFDDRLPCSACDILRLIRNIMDFILIMMIPVGALLFVFAGILILMGGANPGWMSWGKSIFNTTFWGIVMLLLSWVIANTIITSLAPNGFQNPAGGGSTSNWWEINCTAVRPGTGGVGPGPGLGTPTPGPGQVTPTPTPTPGPGQVTPTPTPISGVCPDSNLNVCDPVSTQCGNSTCNQYIASINRHAGGAASASLMKAIMFRESSCNISAASGADSFGLMQLQPATANLYRSQCGVPADVTIDGDWLRNPVNADASICISAHYIRSLAAGQCGSSPLHIAAGYNGGGGACGASADCSSEQSCGGGTKRRWECPYDNPQHTVCNEGFHETRVYAPRVLYCNNNPGF